MPGRRHLLIAAATGALVLSGAGVVGVRALSSGDSPLEPEKPRRTFYVKLFPTEKAFTISTLFIDGAAGKEKLGLEELPLQSSGK